MQNFQARHIRSEQSSGMYIFNLTLKKARTCPAMLITQLNEKKKRATDVNTSIPSQQTLNYWRYANLQNMYEMKLAYLGVNHPAHAGGCGASQYRPDRS